MKTLCAVNVEVLDEIDEILDIVRILVENSNIDKKKSICTLQDFVSDTEDAFLVERNKLLQSNKEFIELFEKIKLDNCETCELRKYCSSYRKKSQAQVSSKLSTVDLFCGAGGLSLGFKKEGFNISLANDIEYSCIQTYRHNHPELPVKHILLGDINNLFEEIVNNRRFKETDIVLGGPPCQGFSEANRQRLIDDPRNYLYKSYVKVLELLQPKFFVMENVKGMKKVLAEIKEDFINIGYSVEARILNAKDFGIPQNRERLIFIGNRIGVDNNQIFDEINHNARNIVPTVLADALYGLKPLKASRIKNATNISTEENGGKILINKEKQVNKYIKKINNFNNMSCVFNHQARYNNDRDIEIFGRLHQGNKSDDPKIADIMPYKSRNNIFKDKYYKLEENKVCKTITAHMKFDCNMYIHPTQARGLTPREAARIQSYPDDYFFKGSFTKTYMQIGNSVPPLMAQEIARVLKNYLM